jgi:hypothetical protein
MKKMAYWKQDYLDAKINDITRRMQSQEEQAHGYRVFTNKSSRRMVEEKRRGRRVEDGLLDWGKESEIKRRGLQENLTPKFKPQLCKKSLELANQRSQGNLSTSK